MLATSVGSRRSLSALFQRQPVSRPNSLHHSYLSACHAESLPPACTSSSPLIQCCGARRLGSLRKSKVISASRSLSFIFIPEPLSTPFTPSLQYLITSASEIIATFDSANIGYIFSDTGGLQTECTSLSYTTK